MKKILMLAIVSILAVGCQSKSTNKGGIDKESFTNKYECTRESTLTQYELEHRDTKSLVLSEEELNEKNNGPLAVNKKIQKIYDFNEDGSKLLKYYDVEKYEYLIEVDMQEEKKYYEKECNNISSERYDGCDITIDGNTLIITKSNNLKSDMNKDMANTTTKDSLIEAYKDGELFTCEG